MKHLLCPTTYEQVLQEDPWECFLCKSRSFTDTIVRPRTNWKDKIINMFRTSCDSNAQHLVAKHNSEKRKIRVLSLFDGLGTGTRIHHFLLSTVVFPLLQFIFLRIIYKISYVCVLYEKIDVFRFTGASEIGLHSGRLLRERDRSRRVDGYRLAFRRPYPSIRQRKRYHEQDD